jgi:hypothetical protein
MPVAIDASSPNRYLNAYQKARAANSVFERQATEFGLNQVGQAYGQAARNMESTARASQQGIDIVDAARTEKENRRSGLGGLLGIGLNAVSLIPGVGTAARIGLGAASGALSRL